MNADTHVTAANGESLYQGRHRTGALSSGAGESAIEGSRQRPPRTTRTPRMATGKPRAAAGRPRRDGKRKR